MDNGLPITDTASGHNGQDPYLKRDQRFYASVVYNGKVFRDRAYESFLPGGKIVLKGMSLGILQKLDI